jgi:hypothetical protein
MDNEQLESNFEPYIRAFVQRWNAYLERENKMFAEVFARPIDGMIGVAFYAVDRQEFSMLMQVVDDSFEKIQKQFPKAEWSQLGNCYPFIEVLSNVIVVIKPNIRHYWGESMGRDDADTTIGQHFVNTMPEEWKHLK